MEVNKTSNFIGQFFNAYIFNSGLTLKEVARLLAFNYSDNDKAICDFKKKKDYLWKQSEVVHWCKSLRIKETSTIYSKLYEKAGKKDLDIGS